MTLAAGTLRKTEVTGMEELQKKISAMIWQTDPKLVRQAVRASLKPMLNAARANAPIGREAHRTYKGRLVPPGFLKKNIWLRKLKTKHKLIIAYAIWAHGEAFYGQIIEAGRKAGREGKHAWGDIPGDPWLGRAYRAHKDQVLENFNREMNKRIIRAAKKIKSAHGIK